MDLESDSFFCRSRLPKRLARSGKQEQGGSGTFHRLEYFRTNYLKKYTKGFAEKVKHAGSFDRDESIPCERTIKTVCAEPLFAGGILEKSCKRPCEHPFEDEEIHSCSQEERSCPLKGVLNIWYSECGKNTDLTSYGGEVTPCIAPMATCLVSRVGRNGAAPRCGKVVLKSFLLAHEPDGY